MVNVTAAEALFFLGGLLNLALFFPNLEKFLNKHLMLGAFITSSIILRVFDPDTRRNLFPHGPWIYIFLQCNSFAYIFQPTWTPLSLPIYMAKTGTVVKDHLKKTTSKNTVFPP